jgi:hypothetical protein
MARYRARIQGQRGAASRLGSARSGIMAAVNGWHLGVRVESGPPDGDADTFDVTVTGGSREPTRGIYLGRVSRQGDRLAFVPAATWVKREIAKVGPTHGLRYSPPLADPDGCPCQGRRSGGTNG